VGLGGSTSFHHWWWGTQVTSLSAEGLNFSVPQVTQLESLHQRHETYNYRQLLVAVWILTAPATSALAMHGPVLSTLPMCISKVPSNRWRGRHMRREPRVTCPRSHSPFSVVLP
jgi:hypothetical protein